MCSIFSIQWSKLWLCQFQPGLFPGTQQYLNKGYWNWNWFKLIDKNLTWRPHIDHIASKISKIVGIIARLRHHVPLNTLLQIYRSLIFPYKLYGVPVWGQASQCGLKKILILQKRALRQIFFSSKRSHAIGPLFVASNILPINMLYFETVSTIMHAVSTRSPPKNIREFLLTFMYTTRVSRVQIIFSYRNLGHRRNLSRSLRLVRDYGTVYTQIGVSSRKEHLKEKFISCF